MNSTNVKTLKIGSTLRLVLEQTEGDFADVVSVTSFLKETEKLYAVPPLSQPALHVLNVVADEAKSSWYITLPASASATLEAGDYAVDARVDTGSEVDHTDTLFIRAQYSVT